MILKAKHLKILTLVALCGPAASVLSVAGTDIPFDARYDVLVDGKIKMETRISLENEGGLWTMKSTSKGTRGIAKFLKVKSSESSSGEWRNGRFRPVEFSHHGKVAGKDDLWSARFDWQEQKVSTTHEDGNSVLPLGNNTHDPVTLTLAIRDLLQQDHGDMDLRVVDEGEIDQHRYSPSAAVTLDTALGCFRSTPVKRVRENSQRYSTGWYAEALEFIPVRIIHGKKGGREFELRIRSLVLDGKEIEGPGDCSP